ncbi:Hypothetical predicted protein [Mytilus galloprovincialis]|uniref:Uncharacterized protein n=1 Tax=Mytilus galloprovincialis TaxID=29158 RepID=A0A8B6C0T7_MYTGA|nr:Hypothetical predicted protein [Mytilus galloprovincialis]
MQLFCETYQVGDGVEIIEYNNLDKDTCLCLTDKNISACGIPIDLRVVKFHAFNVGTFISCIGGQNYIKISKIVESKYGNIDYNVNIDTLVMPTDICSDNNGHIYVSGQGSNNIHRLTQDGKVVDIPLDSRHGITQPVALCFTKNYDKLYIVNEWGKSVLVFDVI